ncbi:response regulator transcription factor [Brevibacillus sp. B_LB10_24]|uniref:response regulator transcription factor n=1 Tax=Brevibacillus sp. B_LB10_24 TaxID=3380645 RepID=UPI0038B81BD1
MNKVLVIEDEKNIARFIELELKHEGCSVTVVEDGRMGLEKAMAEEWDLLLLDLMLPNLNGLEVCRRVRSVKQIPIIMITARDSVLDRVSGLDSGADDYIVKPFAIEELLARMRALSRRTGPRNDSSHSMLTYKDITVDMEAREVKRNDQVIELTKREFDLFFMFLQNINRVLSREAILNEVWGVHTPVEPNTVDVYVRYLRSKVDRPEEESIIQTVRGIGYVVRL